MRLNNTVYPFSVTAADLHYVFFEYFGFLYIYIKKPKYFTGKIKQMLPLRSIEQPLTWKTIRNR